MLNKIRKTWVIPLVVLCFSFSLGVFFWQSNKVNVSLPESSFITTNTKMPSISLPVLGGGEEFLPKKPFILLVWASWCPTCRAELPYLTKVAEDVDLVGIVLRDKENKIQEILGDKNPFVINYLDYTGTFSTSIGALGSPTAFFVDSERKIRARLVGGFNERRWEKSGLKEFFISL